jgi:hypothetical protein
MNTLPYVNSAPASNEPAYAQLRLLRFDGVPTTIPRWVIVMFDDGGHPATGWTRYSTADNRFIRIGASVTQAGTDAHSHTVRWEDPGNPGVQLQIGANNETGVPRDNLLTGSTVATRLHTHTTPVTTTTTSDTCSSSGCFPPHVRNNTGRIKQ